MLKTADVFITAEGRDKGKLFVLTEMPAAQAEKWAARAFLTLGRAGVTVPDEIRGQGMIGLAILGIKALSSVVFRDPMDPSLGAEALMDEMFACVAYCPDQANRGYTRTPVGTDIEEVVTRLKLRDDLWLLHVGFSLAEAASKWTSAFRDTTQSDIPTSAQPSA